MGWDLGEDLLLVADPLDELLAGDGAAVVELVEAGLVAEVVDEDVGVGGQPGEGAGDVVVELEDLLRPLVVQQLQRPRPPCSAEGGGGSD